jgi:hypothetical protein
LDRQFSYNTEWFMEEDAEEDTGGAQDDFDWAAYRKQQLEEDEARIAHSNKGFAAAESEIYATEGSANGKDDDKQEDPSGSNLGRRWKDGESDEHDEESTVAPSGGGTGDRESMDYVSIASHLHEILATAPRHQIQKDRMKYRVKIESPRQDTSRHLFWLHYRYVSVAKS